MTTQSTSIELVSENFNRHVNTIPNKTEGMQVVASTSLSWVDSGLSCDTFNIIHIVNGATLTEEELAGVLNHFRSKQFAFCIWISEEQRTNTVKDIFKKLKLNQQNAEPGMVLDLSTYEPNVNEKHANIRLVKSAKELADYADVIASNWSPPDENVLNYFSKVTTHLLDKSNNILLAAYYDGGKPVCVVELFPSDATTIGIYGFATRKEYQGRGIGSTLFSYSLNLCKTKGYKSTILQASEDGIGIYTRMGFQLVTTYFEYA